MSAITQVLPDDLATFAEAHPQVQILLEERNSAITTKAVAENAADIGIYTVLPHSDAVEHLAYETDELVVVLRKDHALARRPSLGLVDVIDWDFVGLRDGSAINKRIAAAAEAIGRVPRVRVHVTGFDALCLMVGAGMGIAIAPRHTARFYAADLGLSEVQLKEAWVFRELGICVRSTASLSPAGRLLVGHLQNCATRRKSNP
jgi:DNA-binding transcriptional LysR family regulator